MFFSVRDTQAPNVDILSVMLTLTTNLNLNFKWCLLGFSTIKLLVVVFILFFVIGQYFRRGNLNCANILLGSRFHPPVLVLIGGTCLQQLLLSHSNGDSFYMYYLEFFYLFSPAYLFVQFCTYVTIFILLYGFNLIL